MEDILSCGKNNAARGEASREPVEVAKRFPDDVIRCKRSGSLLGDEEDGVAVLVPPRAIEMGSIGRAESMTG